MEGKARGLQHFMRDLVNDYALKKRLDHSNSIISMIYSSNFKKKYVAIRCHRFTVNR